MAVSLDHGGVAKQDWQPFGLQLRAGLGPAPGLPSRALAGLYGYSRSWDSSRHLQTNFLPAASMSERAGSPLLLVCAATFAEWPPPP